MLPDEELIEPVDLDNPDDYKYQKELAASDRRIRDKLAGNLINAVTNPDVDTFNITTRDLKNATQLLNEKYLEKLLLSEDTDEEKMLLARLEKELARRDPHADLAMDKPVPKLLFPRGA
jgi:hypothetical protein